MINNIAYPSFSAEHLRYLSKLKQKKYRLQEKLVIIEGKRTLEQLFSCGIKAIELYVTNEEPTITAEKIYTISEQGLLRICDSEHPQKIAGLFPLPVARKIAFRKAFYLDGISDPGNLGTIFRIAAAFNIDCLILSPNTCEVSSPKVIRASLGAVYKVPFFNCAAENLKELNANIFALDMQGKIPLANFEQPSEPYIVALGNETKGLSSSILEIATETLCIPMLGEMESLNVSISAAILAYTISEK